jgi:hypothetical protein
VRGVCGRWVVACLTLFPHAPGWCRFLISKGKTKEAAGVLVKLRGYSSSDAELEVKEIQESASTSGRVRVWHAVLTVRVCQAMWLRRL